MDSIKKTNNTKWGFCTAFDAQYSWTNYCINVLVIQIVNDINWLNVIIFEPTYRIIFFNFDH